MSNEDGVALTIANELTAALEASGVENFYGLNPKPEAEITYPYATFGFTYSPSTATDGGGVYEVDFEIDLFDRGANKLALLGAEGDIVAVLKRYRELRPKAWVIATLELALDVPTLVDGLHRRLLQFKLRMTLRE